MRGEIALQQLAFLKLGIDGTTPLDDQIEARVGIFDSGQHRPFPGSPARMPPHPHLWLFQHAHQVGKDGFPLRVNQCIDFRLPRVAVVRVGDRDFHDPLGQVGAERRPV